MLYFYKAKNAPIVLITLKKDKMYQLIKWNTDRDEFIEGQWLTRVELDIRHSSISADGEYFYYTYIPHRDGDHTSHIIISKIPYFTALIYGHIEEGRGYICRWDKDEDLPIIRRNLKYFKLRNKHGRIDSLNCLISKTGNIENLKDIEYYRSIKVYVIEGDKIFKDDELIYDANNNEFERVEYY